MAVEHLGPAAHEIIAGCHRQAVEISALQRTYAETLKRRIALDLRNLHEAALFRTRTIATLWHQQ